MQFGTFNVLVLYRTALTELFIGTAYPWTVLDLCYLQNFNSLKEGQGVSLNCQQVFVGPLFFIQSIQNCSLLTSIFTVPVVTIFTKFDAQIVQEFAKLDDAMDSAIKWQTARKNAENTFQKVYLPKVFSTRHPPEAYVQLEGKDKENTFVKINVV